MENDDMKRRITDILRLWPLGISEDGETMLSRICVKPHVFALKVIGDAMAPRIFPGDVVIVDPKAEFKENAIYSIRYNGEEILRRVKHVENRTVLTCLNREFPDIEIEKGREGDFKIVGRIVDMVPNLADKCNWKRKEDAKIH